MKNYRKIFALGFFDGVHLGHQALLRQCAALAQQMDAKPAAITFQNHPAAAFTTQYPPLLTTLSDRKALLRAFGMEDVLALPTAKEVMSTNWRDFLERLLSQGAVGFVCGYDFRFGHKGEGNAEKLDAFCRERGLPCVIVQEQTMDGVRISSTYIRTLIEAGNMETADQFLGHPHVLSGQVVPGRHIGRTIGVPTANILLPADVVVPKLGVYACRCRIGEESYCAVTNIGSRPTVGGHQVRAESWILDFSGELYGKEITLEFCHFLRPEQKFDSLAQLQGEIQKNALQTRKFFEKI